MKSALIMGFAGATLFSGTVAGLLAVQGRLNFDGTRGLPLIEMVFSAPEGGEEGDGHGEDANGDNHGVDGTEVPTHAGMTHEEAGGRVEGLGRETELPRMAGPEVAGIEASGTVAPPGRPEHGADPHADPNADPNAAAGSDSHGADDANGGYHPAPGVETQVSSEFRHQTKALMGQGQYRRGQLLDFPRLSSGMSVGELNDLLAGAQTFAKELELRKSGLEQSELELAAREADLEQRESAVLELQRDVMQKRAKLEEEMQSFQQTFTLVRQAEVDQYKSYAETLASLSTEKSTQIITQLWETEAGKDKAIKILKLMPSESKQEIFGVLDGRKTQDILDRLTGAVVEGQK